jgi:hypothetical protein
MILAILDKSSTLVPQTFRGQVQKSNRCIVLLIIPYGIINAMIIQPTIVHIKHDQSKCNLWQATKLILCNMQITSLVAPRKMHLITMDIDRVASLVETSRIVLFRIYIKSKQGRTLTQVQIAKLCRKLLKVINSSATHALTVDLFPSRNIQLQTHSIEVAVGNMIKHGLSLLLGRRVTFIPQLQRI